MTEMLFFFFVIYVGLWALWAHYIYNPFIGLNGSEGEGIWLVMIAVTFVIGVVTGRLFFWPSRKGHE